MHFCSYAKIDKAAWWMKSKDCGPIVEQATHFCQSLVAHSDYPLTAYSQVTCRCTLVEMSICLPYKPTLSVCHSEPECELLLSFVLIRMVRGGWRAGSRSR